MNGNAQTPSRAEDGGYAGDTQKELMARVRRIETRVTCLGRSFGYQPGNEVPLPDVQIRVEGATVLVNSLSATAGQIMHELASAAPGEYDLVVCGHTWGTLRVR